MTLGHSTCLGPALGCAWNPKSGAMVESEKEGGLELRDPGVYLLLPAIGQKLDPGLLRRGLRALVTTAFLSFQLLPRGDPQFPSPLWTWRMQVARL